MTKPVVLCILDGWGLSETQAGNAPALARTPNFDRLMQNCPNATLITHGPDAGLPSGQMGNSEVGHTNIGAGRVVAMDLGQIDLAIENQSFVIGVNRVGKDQNGLAYCGDSKLVNALGEEKKLKPREESVKSFTLKIDELTAMRKSLPFLKDA